MGITKTKTRGKSAKKPPTFVRRMISIPISFDSQMKQHPEINWSAVAKVAFSCKLEALENPELSDSIKSGFNSNGQQVASDADLHDLLTASHEWIRLRQEQKKYVSENFIRAHNLLLAELKLSQDL